MPSTAQGVLVDRRAPPLVAPFFSRASLVPSWLGQLRYWSGLGIRAQATNCPSPQVCMSACPPPYRLAKSSICTRSLTTHGASYATDLRSQDTHVCLHKPGWSTMYHGTSHMRRVWSNFVYTLRSISSISVCACSWVRCRLLSPSLRSVVSHADLPSNTGMYTKM